MSAPTRVVFDCNIFIQALGAPRGPAGRCVRLALDGAVTLFVSPYVLSELREVAHRPILVSKLRLRSSRIDSFVASIDAIARVIHIFPEVFSYQRDPDDAHYVNLALAADARLIVSRD